MHEITHIKVHNTTAISLSFAYLQSLLCQYRSLAAVTTTPSTAYRITACNPNAWKNTQNSPKNQRDIRALASPSKFAASIRRHHALTRSRQWRLHRRRHNLFLTCDHNAWRIIKNSSIYQNNMCPWFNLKYCIITEISNDRFICFALFLRWMAGDITADVLKRESEHN